MIAAIGGRKFTLGLVYLLLCGSVSILAVTNGVTGWDAAGVSSLFVSAATGLGVVVYGNVKEHQARNGTK